MTVYQTGDLAKQYHVTVRTIQYYDKQGLLKTVTTGENGRRIFDDESKRDLEIILILKQFGFALKDIKKIMLEDSKLQTVRTMLLQRAIEVEEEIQSQQALWKKLKQFSEYIGEHSDASLAKMIHTQQHVKDKSKIKRLTRSMMYTLVPIAILQYTSLLVSIYLKKWCPLMLALPILITYVGYFTRFMHRNVAYICPNCQSTFQPKLIKWMFAHHTPWARKLNCPHCNQVHYCIVSLKQNHQHQSV